MDEGLAHAQALLRAGLGPSASAVSVQGMDAGDVVFFGSLVIHGSDGNRSPLHRRAKKTSAFGFSIRIWSSWKNRQG